jgi:Na+-transporting NADH:ubiquinone oxidoreductase subunit NqrC
VRKALVVLVVLLIAGAFVAGYWPLREKLIQAQAETVEARRQMSETRAQLDQAEARARLGRLFGQFLALEDAVLAANYAEAQALSSSFFNAAREEAGRTGDASVRTALDATLMRRDTVTAGIARGESSVRDALVPIARELRRALGYTVPALVPARPASAESGT